MHHKSTKESVFYFGSHNCMMEDMKEQLGMNAFSHLRGDDTVPDWFVIDWCFIIFLRLGLVPSAHNQFFCFYFHQRLLGQLDPSALLQLPSSRLP